MKKLAIFTTLLAALFAFNACSEEDYESKYRDPSKINSVTLDKLMSGTLIKANDWAMTTYGRYFGYEPQLMLKFSQTLGFTLDPGIYYHDEYKDYGQPYNNYPSMVANYRKMQQVYEDLPDDEKPANYAYLIATETHLYGMMLYILAEYDDIPFSEIGEVALTGDIAYSSPHFENGQTLYSNILDRLGELANEFKTVQKPGSFAQQDVVNHGDLYKWQVYANCLRLRGALKVSTQGPLASKGQAIIKEILDGGYPIVENTDDAIEMYRESTGPLCHQGGSGFDWHNLQTASDQVINRMMKEGDGGQWHEGEDDPRLPLLYCMATKNGEMPVDTPAEEVVNPTSLKDGKAVPSVYRGASSTTDYDTYQNMFFTRVNRGYYSRIRRNGFFWNNHNWSHQIIPAYEMWFIRAEAYLRGWASGDAKTAFTRAISENIKLIFKHQNNRSHTEADFAGDTDYLNGAQQRATIDPDQSIYNEAWITNFANDRWTTHIDGTPYTNDSQFGGKLEAIMEQKWLAFGFMAGGEQWGDMRRTGLPRLTYARDIDSMAETPYPANRLRYIDNERTYNVNFQDEVGSKDNYSDVLFWAIKDWYDGPKY